MIRVAFIAGTYQPNHCGIAHYTERLRTELTLHSGVHTHVLTTYKAAQAYHDPYVQGVVHGWSLLDLLALVHTIQKLDVNIVHFQYTAGRSSRFENKDAILLLPLMLRIKQWTGHIVLTIHEQYEHWESEWQLPYVPRSLIERLKLWGQNHGLWDREGGFLLPASSAIILSNFYHEMLIQSRLPNLSNRIYRIPIGSNIDVSLFDRGDAKQALCYKYDWPEDSVVIVFFGFLNLLKDLEILVGAFKNVLEVKPTTRLLLVGGFENRLFDHEGAKLHREKLHKLIAELGVTEYVQATGYLSDQEVSRHLLGADIGVLPFKDGTTLKSGSLKTLLAHGLPIVATRHNPPDPDLASKFKVRLVAPHDEASLTEALLELISSSKTRIKMSDANHAHLHEFTWSSIALQHIDIYQNILKNDCAKILDPRIKDIDIELSADLDLVEAGKLEYTLQREAHSLTI